MSQRRYVKQFMFQGEENSLETNKAYNREKADKLTDRVSFIILLAIVSALTLTLFYRQTLGSAECYHSDMKAYILEMQGLDSGYSFPYPVLFRLGALLDVFFEPELSMALATMLLNSLAIIITKVFFNKFAFDSFRRMLAPYSWMAGIAISLISV